MELQLTPIMKGGVTVFTGELLAQLRIVNMQLVFLSQLEIVSVGEILYIRKTYPLCRKLLPTVTTHYRSAALAVGFSLVNLQEMF